jgi:HrpA-like RNA helicase
LIIYIIQIGFRIGAIKPRVSASTKIRFVTDSVLLNEYIEDPKLSRYSIVIIDEAHERRVDTDLLFGIMKLCLQQRSDLKVCFIKEIYFYLDFFLIVDCHVGNIGC